MSNRTIVGLLVVLLVAAACDGPVTIDQVLDRAEDALGGSDTLGEIRSVRIVTGGTWESPAANAPPVAYEGQIVYQAPDRIRWEVRPAEGEAVIMGFDGKEAWGRRNGPPARFRGAVRELLLDTSAGLRALLVAPARFHDAGAFSLVSPAPEGVPATYRVSFAPAGGGPWTLWFDRKSGHLVQAEHACLFMLDRGPMRGTWTRSEPKVFGVLTVPSLARFEGRRDGSVLEVIHETIRSIEVNPELAPGFFARPETEIDLDSIGIREVAADTAVTLRHTGGLGSIGQAMDRLAAGALSAGLLATGPVSGIVHDDPRVTAPEELRIDLSLPVMQAGATPSLPEGFSIRRRPAIRVVYAYHAGPLGGEGEAHARIQAWMDRKRLRMAGPPRSLWYHHPDSVIPEDLVTEVRYPIR